MNPLLNVEIAGVSMRLGDRFIQKDGDVLLADLHLGKTMHFRKAGLPVPAKARDADQSSFLTLLDQFRPARMIILGDLFHSEHNSEVDEIAMITSQFPDTQFMLIKGNHDVMPDEVYRTIDMETCDRMDWHGMTLSHEPLSDSRQPVVNVHGHLHPGIVLKGKGRQSEKIPCFHFSGSHFCLPAFGALTGLMNIRPKKGHEVFGIVEGAVIAFEL
ncbi:MAG: ligase-associated DNA damage response endonuclease PdeM [Cryomorphaceae bacterium]